MATTLERFITKVDVHSPVPDYAPELGQCHWWTAYINADGYGQLGIDGKKIYAHRWAYEHYVGPIPEGMHIDHLCRVRHCVRPSHLEPVTQKENILRGEGLCAKNAVKTHCPQGHEYAGENLYLYRRYKRCRACHRAESLKNYYNKKDKNVVTN
jgi:hypothetical protein